MILQIWFYLGLRNTTNFYLPVSFMLILGVGQGVLVKCDPNMIGSNFLMKSSSDISLVKNVRLHPVTIILNIYIDVCYKIINVDNNTHMTQQEHC